MAILYCFKIGSILAEIDVSEKIHIRNVMDSVKIFRGRFVKQKYTEYKKL